MVVKPLKCLYVVLFCVAVLFLSSSVLCCCFMCVPFVLTSELILCHYILELCSVIWLMHTDCQTV